MGKYEKKRKPKSKKSRWIVAAVILLVLLAALSTYGDSGSVEEDAAGETVAAAVAQTEATAEAVPETTEAAYQWDAGNLAYLGLGRDELLEIYCEYDGLMMADEAASLSSEEVFTYEAQCREQVAAEYGITADDVSNIYIYGMAVNYFATFDVNAVELPYADSVEVSTFGNEAIVKAHITAGLTNKLTIDKNYYNACDFIRDYAGTDFDTISYWAVAPATDGSEAKVISFTVPTEMINKIAAQAFADNTLGDYVDDLYILPSLLS